MKEGKEYEDFVYKIFSEFFKDFLLKQNDRIKGTESGRLREIDISIRGKIDGVDLLYVVQAKDYKNHKADLNVIGSFSSVIKDIGASKGFLVCSSGFAKSNSQYARTLGIELLSVEDIDSSKWKAVIEIPVVYINYTIFYSLSHSSPGNLMMELFQSVENFSITPEDYKSFSIDGGKSFLNINEHIANFLQNGKASLKEKKAITFDLPVRLTKFPKFEFTVSSLVIDPQKKAFLKYIVPDQYRGIRDHLNKTFIPTTLEITNIPFQLDDTFIPIQESEIPINPAGYSIQVEAIRIN